MRSARRVFTGFGLVGSASCCRSRSHGPKTRPPRPRPDLPSVAVSIGEPDAPEPIPAGRTDAAAAGPARRRRERPPAEAAQAARPPEDLAPALPDAPGPITAADRLRSALASGRRDRPHRAAAPAGAGGARDPLRPGAPLWVSGEAFTPAAKAVMHRLKAADEDGLDPTDYRVPRCRGPRPRAGGLGRGGDEAQRRRDPYARDARGARIEPPRISRLVTPTLALPAPRRCSQRLGAAADAGAALAAYNPPHPGYRALKARLAAAARRPPRPADGAVPRGPRSGSACAIRGCRSSAPASGSARRTTATTPMTSGWPRRWPSSSARRASGERRAHAADHGSPVRTSPPRGSRATSSPTWNAGAGCPPISARATSP